MANRLIFATQESRNLLAEGGLSAAERNRLYSSKYNGFPFPFFHKARAVLADGVVGDYEDVQVWDGVTYFTEIYDDEFDENSFVGHIRYPSNSTTRRTPLVGAGTPWVPVDREWLEEWFWRVRLLTLSGSMSGSFSHPDASGTISINTIDGTQEAGGTTERPVVLPGKKRWNNPPRFYYFKNNNDPPNTGGVGTGTITSEVFPDDRPEVVGHATVRNFNTIPSPISRELDWGFVWQPTMTESNAVKHTLARVVDEQIYFNVAAIFAAELYLGVFEEFHAEFRTDNRDIEGAYHLTPPHEFNTVIQSIPITILGTEFSIPFNKYRTAYETSSGGLGGFSETFTVDFALTAQEYWPYAAKDGTPIYHTTTGAQLQDPRS